jgi:hypothetical protein
VKPNFEKVRFPNKAAVCLVGGPLAYQSPSHIN